MSLAFGTSRFPRAVLLGLVKIVATQSEHPGACHPHGTPGISAVQRLESRPPGYIDKLGHQFGISCSLGEVASTLGLQLMPSRQIRV